MLSKSGNPLISLPSYIFMKNQLQVGTKTALSFNLRHFWLMKLFRRPRFQRKTDCFSRFLVSYFFILNFNLAKCTVVPFISIVLMRFFLWNQFQQSAFIEGWNQGNLIPNRHCKLVWVYFFLQNLSRTQPYKIVFVVFLSINSFADTFILAYS